MDTTWSLKLPRDFSLGSAVVLLCILDFLPILNVLHPYILTSIKVFALFIIYFYIIKTNVSLFTSFIVIAFIITAVSLLAFYHCWNQFTTVGGFVINNLTCWFYMEIGIFLLRYGTDAIKRMIRFVFLAVVIVTSFTSIFSLNILPEAVRGLNNGSIGITGYEQFLYSRNTATWGILYGVVFVLPYLIMWLKQQDNSRRKLIIYLIISFLFYFIVKSQVFLGILISIVFLSFVFFKPFGLKKIFFSCLALILFSSFLLSYSSELLLLLNELAMATNNAILQRRTNQLYSLISSFAMTGTILVRYELYMTSFMSFLDNPIFGVALDGAEAFEIIGLHSQIFDMMAATGLVGFIPYMGCFIWLIKTVLQSIYNPIEKRYYLWTVGMLFILMLLNPTYYASSIYFSAFLGPFLFHSAKKNLLMQHT